MNNSEQIFITVEKKVADNETKISLIGNSSQMAVAKVASKQLIYRSYSIDDFLFH